MAEKLVVVQSPPHPTRSSLARFCSWPHLLVSCVSSQASLTRKGGFGDRMKFYFFICKMGGERGPGGDLLWFAIWWECTGLLRDGGMGHGFVTVPCVRETRGLALPRKVFRQQKCRFPGSQMLYLELTFTFLQINSSVCMQVQELCCDSEHAGFYSLHFSLLAAGN